MVVDLDAFPVNCTETKTVDDESRVMMMINVRIVTIRELLDGDDSVVLSTYYLAHIWLIAFPCTFFLDGMGRRLSTLPTFGCSSSYSTLATINRGTGGKLAVL
jgi:hypothetical protein